MNIYYHFIMDPRTGGPHQFVKNFVYVTKKEFNNFVVINGKRDKKINLVFYRNFSRYFYFFEVIINFFKFFFFLNLKIKIKK